MTKNVPHPLIALLAALALALAAYWYFSPYWVLRSMHTAIEQKNAEAFNRYVDYPKLRDSIKSEVAGRFAAHTAEAPEGARGLGVLGSALAMMLINPAIDLMVRPEFVMSSMARGEADIMPGEVREALGQPDASAPKPRWESDRQGLNMLVVSSVDPVVGGKKKLGLVLERTGFADWKLTGLRFASDPTR